MTPSIRPHDDRRSTGSPASAVVLFDIDGTLLRGGDPAHLWAFERAMRQTYGVPATLEGVPLAGHLDSAIAERALAPHGVTAAAARARLAGLADAMGTHYRARVGTGSRVDRRLPGVPAVLEALRAHGARLGVVTGNVEAVARHKLHAAGLEHLLTAGAYGDAAVGRDELVAVATAKLAGAADRAVVVGDTAHDVHAAHRAGARAVAVATGPIARGELTAAGADAVLDDLGDVTGAVTTILAAAGAVSDA